MQRQFNFEQLYKSTQRLSTQLSFARYRDLPYSTNVYTVNSSRSLIYFETKNNLVGKLSWDEIERDTVISSSSLHKLS